MSKQKKNAKKPAASKAAGKNKTIKSQRQTAVKSVTKNCQKPKRKNVSQKIPNGRTLQTRDEFFEGQEKYRKPGYENKGLYRKVVVVDSNRADELAVVKLTTQSKEQLYPIISRENRNTVLLSQQKMMKTNLLKSEKNFYLINRRKMFRKKMLIKSKKIVSNEKTTERSCEN